jgi:hypothetical protein
MKVRKGLKQSIPNTDFNMVTTYTVNLSDLENIIDLFEMSYLPLCMFTFYIVEKINGGWGDREVIYVEFRKNFLVNPR